MYKSSPTNTCSFTRCVKTGNEPGFFPWKPQQILAYHDTTTDGWFSELKKIIIIKRSVIEITQRSFSCKISVISLLEDINRKCNIITHRNLTFKAIFFLHKVRSPASSQLYGALEHTMLHVCLAVTLITLTSEFDQFLRDFYYISRLQVSVISDG